MPSRQEEVRQRKTKKLGLKKVSQEAKRTAKSAGGSRKGDEPAAVRGTKTSPGGLSALQANHQALREGEEKYRVLFNQARDGIVLVDAGTGHIIDCNLEFEKQTGRKLNQLMKMKIWEVRPPEKVEAAKRKFFEIREKKSGGSSELEFQQPNGGIVPVEFIGTVITLGDRKCIQSIVRDITDRKLAEEKLAEANKLFEALLDHTHMMVAYLDPEFSFVKVNRAYAEADRRVPSFFPGKNHFKLYPNAENEEIFRRVVETGEPYFASAKAFEYAEHPERGVSYWDWSLIPIRDSVAAVTGLVLTLVNVTERKQAEQALSQSEERLRRFMESATDSFTLWDKNLNVVETNEAGLKTYAAGTKKADMIGKNMLELVPGLIESGRYDRYVRVIQTGKPFHADDVVIDPRFGSRRVAVSAFKVGDGLGMVVTDITERKLAEEALKKAHHELEIRVQERTQELRAANMELHEEIAERKRAEEKLRESEENYKTLVETSNDMIFTVDLKGNFQFTNQAFGKVLGYSAEEIERINGFELIHPEDSEIVREQFARLVEGNSVDNMEYRYKTKDGSYISILNNASPIFDPNGNVVAALGAARNITERKRAEDELKQHREHLEELVDERTAELKRANQRLKQEIAERRRTEEALKAEKEFTETALNAQTDTFFVFEPSTGRAVRWNKAFNKVSGYSDEEIRSMKAPDSYYNQEDLKKAAVASRKILNEGIATVELSLITKEGRSIPTEYTGSAIRDDEGNPHYIIAVGRDVTERKRVEETIRQQNEFLNNVIESLTHPFYVIDVNDYTIKAANSAAGLDGLSGTPTCYALTHQRRKPCEGSEHPCPLKEVKETKKPVVAEHIHYDKEGRARNVEVYAYPISDSEKNVVEMIEYCLDVTERKQAETALRESEEKFRNLADQSPNMIFINKGGRVVYANKKCEEIIGYKREEFYSPDFDFFALISPQSKDLIKSNFSKHTSGEEVLPCEYALVTKEGKKIDAILTTKLIGYEGKNAILGTVTDITERKRTEEDLQKRTHDLDERVKELNCLFGVASLVQKPGISLEEILEGTLQLIPPAWRYPEITCARLVLEDQVFTTKNFRETNWRQASGIIVGDHPVGTLEVYYLEEKPERDEGPFLAEERSLINAIAERLARITERKKGEQQIQELNRSLKLRAAELAAANKELEAFSYSVSHDLRAPLRAVEGFSRALAEDYSDSLDEEGKDYLRRIGAASQHMKQLIEDLLNLSLTMRKEMRREETNLSELAHTITSELQKTEPKRQVQFVIQERVLAHGDRRLLRDVLENLLGNAWKFTEKHSQAKIEFGVTRKEGQSVYFVRDDGAGFDETHADRLFVPFQRLHSTAEFSGNGIGLAVVSRIITRHGGKIWAEGEVEKGATFYFTLRDENRHKI